MTSDSAFRKHPPACSLVACSILGYHVHHEYILAAVTVDILGMLATAI